MHTADGGVHTIEASSDDTVEAVRVKVLNVTDVPVDTQLLLFNGRALLNGKTLGQYGVGPESTLTVSVVAHTMAAPRAPTDSVVRKRRRVASVAMAL